MNFLRENLFMMVLTIGTLVLCLILVFWSNAISSQITEEEIGPRESLSKTIRQLDRAPYANGNTIMAETSRVEGITESLRKVGSENIDWNSRNFSVRQLTMLDGSTRPAFPFVATVWEKNQLASRFVGQYHDQLASLLASLNPTGLPTPAELQEEAQHQEKIITRREQIRLKGQKDAATPKTPGRATLPRAVTPRRPSEMLLPDMDRMGVDPRRPAGRKSSTSFSDEADARARDVLRVRKAQDGAIYADETAFQIEYARGVLVASSDVDPEKLWDAQVGLWVQSDIVGAINDTIQTAQNQQKLPPNQRNVITSPIKRLMKITVGESDGSATRRRSTRNVNTMMPPDMRGGYDRYSPGERPGMGRPSPSRRTPRRQTTGTDTPGEKPDTLTRNAANKIFDVVDYSFTVLMPTRYLPLLEERLLKRNYHVILNMQIESPDAEASSQNRSAGDVEGLHYYGVEPLCKVTISGQLLLVTGFTRGLWDDENKQWLRKPLMPLGVMKQLDTGVLRDEDRKLIDDRLPQPWNPAASTPKTAESPQPERRPRGRRKIIRPTYK